MKRWIVVDPIPDFLMLHGYNQISGEFDTEAEAREDAREWSLNNNRDFYVAEVKEVEK